MKNQATKGKEERVLEEAKYIVKEKSTVRAAAKVFGLSKSTIYSDMTNELKKTNKDLFDQVQEVLKENKAQRHIRGGAATKRMYAAKKG